MRVFSFKAWEVYPGQRQLRRFGKDEIIQYR